MTGTIDEIKQQLEDMKSHFKGGFSSTEQELIEELYVLLFRKHIVRSGCQDCYRDAYILISNKIKTMTELPKPSNYVLQAGILEHPFGTSEYYVLDMPDEAAEKMLHDFPDKINEFQRYPEDWEARVAARFAPESTNDDEVDKVITQQKRGRKKASI